MRRLGVDGMRCQPGGDFASRQRRRQHIALNGIGAQDGHGLEQVFVLDAFHDHGLAQGMAQARELVDEMQHVGGVFIADHHQAAVDLDRIERQLAHALQAAVPRPQVVLGQADAQLQVAVQRGDGVDAHRHVVGLEDFERENGRRAVVRRQGLHGGIVIAAVAQRVRGHVDGDGHVRIQPARLPGEPLAQGLIQAPGIQHKEILGGQGREEFAGRQQPLAVAQAGQGLDLDDAARLQIEQRLIDHAQCVGLDQVGPAAALQVGHRMDDALLGIQAQDGVGQQRLQLLEKSDLIVRTEPAGIVAVQAQHDRGPHTGAAGQRHCHDRAKAIVQRRVTPQQHVGIGGDVDAMLDAIAAPGLVRGSAPRPWLASRDMGRADRLDACEIRFESGAFHRFETKRLQSPGPGNQTGADAGVVCQKLGGLGDEVDIAAHLPGQTRNAEQQSRALGVDFLIDRQMPGQVAHHAGRQNRQSLLVLVAAHALDDQCVEQVFGKGQFFPADARQRKPAPDHAGHGFVAPRVQPRGEQAEQIGDLPALERVEFVARQSPQETARPGHVSQAAVVGVDDVAGQWRDVPQKRGQARFAGPAI